MNSGIKIPTVDESDENAPRLRSSLELTDRCCECGPMCTVAVATPDISECTQRNNSASLPADVCVFLDTDELKQVG